MDAVSAAGGRGKEWIFVMVDCGFGACGSRWWIVPLSMSVTRMWPFERTAMFSRNVPGGKVAIVV